jgi:hypothetical protein
LLVPPRDSFGSFVCLFVVLALLPVSADGHERLSIFGSEAPDLLKLSRSKATCCGASSEPAGFSPLAAPEYETYRLTGTYFNLNEGLTVTLMLNNKGAQPLAAIPTIYSMSGARLQLAPITVPAASYIDVDMYELLSTAAPEFREGSMKIAYEGISQQLGAQIKMIDAPNGMIWAEQFAYTSKFVSSQLEALWWLPFQNSETKVIVSNTSGGTVSATITVDGTSPHQAQPLVISLAPWETRSLDIIQDIAQRNNGHIHTTGGISISHTGAPGAVLARMMVGHASKGYSAVHSFTDPGASNSQRWHGNGFRFRNIDGTKLNPTLAARNTAGYTSNITGRILFTRSDGTQATINIPPTAIPAGSTKDINLSQYINAAGVPADVQYGGLELEYTTLPGSVITSVQSISTNGEHVFQVPMMDPDNMPASAGGFPWKADGDFTTVVYIKNETGTPRKYIAHLLYPGGQYSTDEQTIKPNQTIAIDFRELRDNQTPDGMGRVIPLEADIGQIAWTVKGGENKVLSGRSEQISTSGGVASTYSCANCCPDSVYQTGILPDWLELEFESNGFMGPVQTDISCNQTLFGPYSPSGVFWNSDNTNVVSVWDGELVPEGVGTATVSAAWETCLWWLLDGQCGPVCDQIIEYGSVAVAQEVLPLNVTTDINGTNASFSSGIGTPTATVSLANPSHPVCYSSDRSSFNIFVNFRMPENVNVMSESSTYTYVSESGTLWQYQAHEFVNLSYTFKTGSLKIRMRQNNLNEFEDKDWIRFRIGATLTNGNRVSGVGRVKFSCP